MNLVIDTGNSYTKLAVFECSEIIFFEKYVNLKSDDLILLLGEYEIKNCIHSSVNDRDENIITIISNKLKYIKFTQNTPIPIFNEYETPETLGLDRLAAIVGASTIFRNMDVLVIDVGTAMKFDLLLGGRSYIGGNISPGLEMRFKALHTFTDQLPEMGKNEKFRFLGNTTKTAITSGVQVGIVAEIEYYIDRCLELYPNINVVMTGGDTFFFDKIIKRTIFAEPYLVLKGLNRIIEYNDD